MGYEKDDRIEHRNFGWMPLYNTEDKTPGWIKNELIPFLNKETGINWRIVGNNLLHSDTTIIFLPINSMWEKFNGVFNENPAPCSIKKKYPVVKGDEFGYKLEKRIHPKNRPRQHIAYEGFWALSVDSIIERGRITGEKFGL